MLIVHQRVLANSLRDVIRSFKDKSLERVNVASWFMMTKKVRHESITKLNKKEDELMKPVDARKGYDMSDQVIRYQETGSGRVLSQPSLTSPNPSTSVLHRAR